MRVLVTGASGFLGGRVVESLLLHKVTNLRLVVRRPNPALQRRIRDLSPHAHIEWCQGDLTNRQFADVVAQNVDVVIHLAAALRGNPAEVIFATAVATDFLFAALQRHGVERVVLVSSFSVFGLASLRWNAVLDETCSIEPFPERRDPYTYAKLKQEELLRKYNLPGVVLRPGVVYGEGGSALSARVGLSLGPWFLRLGGGSKLPLTYVGNCADAVAMAGLVDRVEGEVINIVDDEILTAREYARLYQQRVRRVRTIPVPYPFLLAISWLVLWYSRISRGQIPAVLTPYKVAAMWKRCRFDNTKAKRLLGWRPRVGLVEALDRAFEYHRSHLI